MNVSHRLKGGGAATVRSVELWVYENWRAHGHRATIHRGECGSCKAGAGRAGGTAPTNGRWLGPFNSGAAAGHAAGCTGAEVRRCSMCSPPT